MADTWKERIARVLFGNKYGLHVDDIAKNLLETHSELNTQYSVEELAQKASAILSSDIRKYGRRSRFCYVKNKKTKAHKRGWYRCKTQRKTGITRTIEDMERGAVTETKSSKQTTFIGKAGEYAVLSELLFNDFNVALMTVDVGVDIVAFKNGKYFYIQVKTAKQREYTFYASINAKQFEKYNEASTYYIFVLRYSKKNRDKENNNFIIINSPIIQILRDKDVIKKGNTLNLTFNLNKGHLLLNNQEDISIYLNRFEYIN